MSAPPREKEGQTHNVTAQKVKEKLGYTERTAKSETSKPATGQPSVQFSGRHSLQRGAPRGAVKMRGVCEIREGLDSQMAQSEKRQLRLLIL